MFSSSMVRFWYLIQSVTIPTIENGEICFKNIHEFITKF